MTLKNETPMKPLRAVIAFFVGFTCFTLLFREFLSQHEIDTRLLLIANLLLFVISLFTLKNSLNALKNSNPHAFVRSYYAGFLIRLLTLGLAAFLYIYLQHGKVHTVSLFLCLGIYAIYSAMEVTILRKKLHQNKNA